jgi:nucleotide-binding universal stress UspA family protein
LAVHRISAFFTPSTFLHLHFSKKLQRMRILLALDGSKESIEAAKFLSHLPIVEQSEVLVVSVLARTSFDDVEADSGLLLRDAEHAAARLNFEMIEANLSQAGAKLESLIVDGHPNRELMSVGKQRDVDLIVLGARGHSLLARALLGSTSDYIANNAGCPVLVVRPSHAEQAGHLRILLAYDGSSGSKIAARQLFAMPWGERTEVLITTLLERPSLLPEDTVYDSTAVDAAETNLVNLVAAAKCAANVNYKVRETVHVGSCLSNLSQRENCDLIFIGHSGKSAIARFFLGSAARHVLHHSECSVWIARPKCW